MDEELIKNLEILFAYDDYEEIMYPIIEAYFLNSIGKPKDDSFFKEHLEKAYTIIAEDRRK